MNNVNIRSSSAGAVRQSVIIVSALLFLGILAFLAWYRWQTREPALPYMGPRESVPLTVPGEGQPPVGEEIQNPDLGSEVFEKSANPLKNELPETVAPVPNPLENIYKNPFE